MTTRRQGDQTLRKHFGDKYIVAIGILTVLVIGMGLSFFLEKKDDVILPIPVRLKNVPCDLVAMPDVSTLEVHVRGPAKLLDEFKSQDTSYTVDLSAGKPGSLPINICKDAIRVPPKLAIVSVQPESLTINFEQRLKKMVAVVPDLCGEPPGGYVVSRVAVTPSTVELSGPYTVIDSLTAIRTTMIDVKGLNKTIKKKVALALKPELYIQPANEELVDVEIIIEEKNVEKGFEISVEGRNTLYHSMITPSTINIRIKGPIKTIEELTKSQDKLKAYADLNNLEPGVYVRKVAINLPLNVLLVDAKPEVFTVKITK